MSERCPECGWPIPTGACGRCDNEARETLTLRAYNVNHCPACSDLRPCGASWVSPAEVLRHDL